MTTSTPPKSKPARAAPPADATTPDSIEALQREVASLRAHLERTQTAFQREYRSALEDIALSSLRPPIPPPDGLIHSLAEQFGRSGFIPKLVQVQSSSDGGPSIFAAMNATNCDFNSVFCSPDAPNQWLRYSFDGRARFVTSYVIESCPFGIGSIHPRSWTLEGSDDCNEWSVLDTRRESDVLNGPSVLGNFGVDRPGSFNHFRLRQTGPNHSGNDIFAFCYFDLCGGTKADGRRRLTFEVSDPVTLQGIIRHLSEKCEGNVARKGVVKVTGIPLDSASNHAVENVVDLGDSSSHFWSKDSPNQWFSYDFCERRIVCRSYVIRTTSGGDSGFNHLRSWVIEISDDSEGPWTVIDRRTDNSQLNSRSAIARFDIENPEESRLIRLRQTDKNYYHSPSGCTHSIVISALEIFGDLIGND
jgi:hypothetical protein